jgi:3-phosphoshikimate 1-carboxyvinyltransferase
MTEQLILDTYKYTLGGRVDAIASKSVAHRLLLAAALSDAATEVVCSTTSADIEATASCLSAMGTQIQKEGNVFHITPTQHYIENAAIDCGESGSTLRFLLPVIGILGQGASITAHGRLPERPLSPLYEEMQRHGAILSPQGSVPLSCQGKMSGGSFTIAGNISSQYITGLLFALPLSETDSEIHITGKLESRPYVNITLQVLSSFGIQVQENTEGADTIFRIPGGQTYHSKGHYTVEGDWSNAAFFLCAGAMSKEGITTCNLNVDSLQGDKKVLDILQEFGAAVTYTENSHGLTDITVCGDHLKGIEIDAADIPDLVPILAAVAAVANGTTYIRNIERLRIKESDRVQTVIQSITNLGGEIREENRQLVIQGKPHLTGGTVDSVNDHRIAMMAGIASSRCTGPVTILDPMAVRKSYPNFYQDFKSLLRKL